MFNSNIPKKENKLLLGLSDFVASNLDKTIIDKADLLDSLTDKKVHVFGQILDSGDFKNIAQRLTEDQWPKLIQSANSKITQQMKKRLETEEAKNTLVSMIAKDNFLKHHNVAITELRRLDKDYYEVKVYLVCGAGFLEGSFKQIIRVIKETLRENDVNVRVLCLRCSSKNLRFSGPYCLCNDCGTLSDIDEDQIIKTYDEKDKSFWWAKAMADMTVGRSNGVSLPKHTLAVTAYEDDGVLVRMTAIVLAIPSDDLVEQKEVWLSGDTALDEMDRFRTDCELLAKKYNCKLTMMDAPVPLEKCPCDCGGYLSRQIATDDLRRLYRDQASNRG